MSNKIVIVTDHNVSKELDLFVPFIQILKFCCLVLEMRSCILMFLVLILRILPELIMSDK